MKAVFLSCNQSMYEAVMDIMKDMSIRGFTGWEELMGRGTKDGEPHLGNHAWPSMNSSILAIVEDEKVAPVMDAIRRIDAEIEKQGCRAFVWNIEQAM